MVGKPIIKSTRMPVELVLAKLSANPDPEALLADYPHLTIDRIRDCLRVASYLVQQIHRPSHEEAEAQPVAHPST
jgi:uncharacterized protein (DUF433 family)